MHHEVPAPKEVLTAAELAELETLEKQMEQASLQAADRLEMTSSAVPVSRLHCSDF